MWRARGSPLSSGDSSPLTATSPNLTTGEECGVQIRTVNAAAPGRAPTTLGWSRTVMKRLSRKLGDDANNPRYIFTEPRVGYRIGKGETLGKGTEVPPSDRP